MGMEMMGLGGDGDRVTGMEWGRGPYIVPVQLSD